MPTATPNPTPKAAGPAFLALAARVYEDFERDVALLNANLDEARGDRTTAAKALEEKVASARLAQNEIAKAQRAIDYSVARANYDFKKNDAEIAARLADVESLLPENLLGPARQGTPPVVPPPVVPPVAQTPQPVSVPPDSASVVPPIVVVDPVDDDSNDDGSDDSDSDSDDSDLSLPADPDDSQPISTSVPQQQPATDVPGQNVPNQSDPARPRPRSASADSTSTPYPHGGRLYAGDGNGRSNPVDFSGVGPIDWNNDWFPSSRQPNPDSISVPSQPSQSWWSRHRYVFDARVWSWQERAVGLVFAVLFVVVFPNIFHTSVAVGFWLTALWLVLWLVLGFMIGGILARAVMHDVRRDRTHRVPATPTFTRAH